MIKVEVKSIFKSFERPDGKLKVLEDVSIVLNENEFVSILGPSGCGKSTLLRAVAGLLEIDKGKISIDGEISYLRQNSSLMPWRNILENVLLPIEIQKRIKPQYTDELRESFSEFGLSGFEKSMPDEISGGMAKRAALLRTYLEDRNIMLLDEPFSSLDAITRKAMGRWLLEVWNKHRKSVLFVTHDIEEALLLSDR
ncbi:MAG: ATP-binding cassette domain-containing protein, partial [Clostridia bacterium]|nr:ATP-binding cassette domain-containing protein [Clostridia bacterium]